MEKYIEKQVQERYFVVGQRKDGFTVFPRCSRSCDEALSYLVEVLEQPEFPRSYSIEFRGAEKFYLPIPGLPKKGVHQLFACAVRYPRLHVRMENYARLAMQNMKPAKEFRTLIANEEGLDALLEIKAHLEYHLPEESDRNQEDKACLRRDVLRTIWGKESENGGGKVIKTAPKELREQYQRVFA